MKIGVLSASILDEAKAQWATLADQLDMPFIDYDKTIDWARQHMNYDAPTADALAYGIFSDEKNVIAIIEIIYTTKNKVTVGWLKMMDIKLSPEFSSVAIEAAPEKYNDVLDIYIYAVGQVVALTDIHRARVVKLYGRTIDLLRLLTMIQRTIASDPLQRCNAEMNGRWLVLSEK